MRWAASDRNRQLENTPSVMISAAALGVAARTSATKSLMVKSISCPTAETLDDDPQTGWSIKGGQGKTQNAVFQFVHDLTNANEFQLDLVDRTFAAAGK